MVKRAISAVFLSMLFLGTAYSAEKIVKLRDTELVYVPAGEFRMGDEERRQAKPVHKVKLRAFYIGKNEVTNAEYKRFCDDTKRKYPDNPHWDSDYFIGKPDYPVIYVTWLDASDYAKWAGGRLPTEAEWEYAARGGTTTYYYWGDDLTHNQLNYLGVKEGERDQWEHTSPVSSFPPNQFGLYDMLGNVWEWVADWYAEDYYSKSPKENPKGPQKGTQRILKGDGWSGGSNHGPSGRWWKLPSEKSDFTGFRIAKDAK